MDPITEWGRSQNTADDTTSKRLLGLDEPNARPQNMQQQLANEWQMHRQLEKAKEANQKTTAAGLVSDAGYSAIYSGFQSPAIGLTQLVSPQLAKDIAVMAPPQEAEFGTARWHAQTIGDAAGMMLPFMLTRGAMKKAGLTFAAKEQTSLAAMKLAAGSSGTHIADSAMTGFVFDFMTRPADMSKNNFWAQRTKNGVNGAVTFGTLSAAAAKLGSSTRSLSAELAGTKKVAYDAGISSLSGIPAGIVNAETSAILNEGRLATTKEVVQGGYSMMVAGGVLGLAESVPKERARLAERSRATQEQALRDAVLQDREAIQTIVDTIELATDMTEAHKDSIGTRRDHWLNAKGLEMAPGTVSAEHSVSLRDLAAKRDATFTDVFQEYHQKQSEAIPHSVSRAIEFRNKYRVRRQKTTDDILVLRDQGNEVVGGVEYWINGKSACVRDMWLDGNRSASGLARLAQTFSDHIKSKGASEVFIENSTLTGKSLIRPIKSPLSLEADGRPAKSTQVGRELSSETSSAGAEVVKQGNEVEKASPAPSDAERAKESVEPVQDLSPVAKDKTEIAAEHSAKTQSGTELTTEATDRTKVSDKAAVPGMIVPSETISMRELVRENDPRVDELMERYYPELEKAFPLEGEIETPETYKEYLANESGTWDMILLRDSEQNIIGGIQFQVVDAKGEALKKVAWVEHIWVKEENRNFPNFKSLLRIAEQRTKAAGAELVFMEFNNPNKMTAEQMAEDAEGGITTQDRETLWGSVGIHVAVDSKGEIAPYGQPSMDGQPAVEYLSLGFIGPNSLTGQQIPIKDYVSLAQAAHSTIPGVDLQTDPTVQGYTKGCNILPDQTFTLKPLADIAKARRGPKK